MTSPNLPFVHSGLIWDGVTEYQNSTPADVGTIWMIRMAGDGSRRYTEYLATTNPMDILRRFSAQEDAWETIGVTYESAASILLIGHTTYLDYDGSVYPLIPSTKSPTSRPTSATRLSPPTTSR